MSSYPATGPSWLGGRAKILRTMFGKSVDVTENRDFEVGRLVFDPRSGRLSARAASCRLEPKAAAVLSLLCREEGRMVSRQALLDGAWGEGEGSDEALTQVVAQIRRALETLGEPGTMIETLSKRGYRLDAAAGSAAATADPQETPPPGAMARPEARSSRRPWLIATVVAAALMIGWLALPHGPRHFVRHALGLGPSAQGPAHSK